MTQSMLRAQRGWRTAVMNGCSTAAHSSPQELGTPEEQSSPGPPQHAAFKGASRSDSSAKLVHGAAWSSGGGGGGGSAVSEQSLPKKPGAQVQVNCCSLRCPPPFPPLGVHRPPFRQGFGWHGDGGGGGCCTGTGTQTSAHRQGEQNIIWAAGPQSRLCTGLEKQALEIRPWPTLPRRSQTTRIAPCRTETCCSTTRQLHDSPNDATHPCDGLNCRFAQLASLLCTWSTAMPVT